MKKWRLVDYKLKQTNKILLDVEKYPLSAINELILLWNKKSSIIELDLFIHGSRVLSTKQKNVLFNLVCSIK